MRFATLIFTLTTLTLTIGCRSAVQKAVRDTKYSAYELVGIEKRDLLKDRVDDVRDDQKDAQESFEDALTRLRKLYDMKGSELESHYNKLSDAYKDADEDAKEVGFSIEKMETVASDLFGEWKKEIGEIKTEEFKVKSQAQLKGTQARYQEMRDSLRAAEKKMPPVLAKMKDHVLYLKHNLNAQSIASLKGESARIENEIENLIKDMNASIEEAARFIKTIQ